MAEEEVISGHVSDEEEEKVAYKAPPEKTLTEIVQQDQEDESLRKYKETLLGASSAVGSAIIIGKYNLQCSIDLVFSVFI